MNKGILVKIGIVAGFFILMLVGAWGCTVIKNNDKSAELTDGEKTYITIDGVEVTRSELYHELILSNGANYLVQYAEEILLADYIDKVTDEEILAEKDILIYQTTNQKLMDELKADEEMSKQLNDSFKDQMMVLGYDSENMDDLRSYLELNIAKQNYLNDYLDGLSEDDPMYISEDDIEDYYEDNDKGSVNVLTVRFTSKEEAEAALNAFNIVPFFEDNSWGLYDPALNEDATIEDAIEADSIDETNTTVLTDEEVLGYFVQIYNVMNKNAQIVDGTEAALIANSDLTLVDYKDYTNTLYSNNDKTTYTNYIFDTLEIPSEDNEDASRYSYKIQTIGDYAIISYKLVDTDPTAYADLDADTLADLEAEYKDTKQTTAYLDAAMEELWLAQPLEIFDPIMKLQYAYSDGKEFDNNGSKKYVATLGETEITADDFFAYIADDYGLYTSIDLAQTKALLQSDLYKEVYEDTKDYSKSDNETMKKHVDDLENFKSYFESNAFAQAGLSSEDFTWSEFVILYLKCDDDYDVLEKISIAGNLQSYLINDLIKYEDAVNFMKEQEENYFSLNAEHLLLFRDDDFDFNGDDYSDYLDTLIGQDKTDYIALRDEFAALVEDKVKNEDMSLEDIVTDYNESYRGDATNEWAKFKEAGFYVLTQNLSEKTSLTYLNTYTSYDEEFVKNLKRVYDAYVTEVNDSAEAPEFYADDQMFDTDFGAHYIYATEGTDFDQPSAVFDNADGDYVDANVGTTVIPNKAQVELYISTKFSAMIGEDNSDTIAADVEEALNAYYVYLYDFYWPTDNNQSNPVTIMTIQYALDNDVTFADNNTENIADLTAILDSIRHSNFPEGFFADED